MIALTHLVSPRIGECEVTFVEREPIDEERIKLQHHRYCDALRRAGAAVKVLSANQNLPDSCFVEDAAIVLDSIAVITCLGAASRRGESAAIASALSEYRELATIQFPATIDGGDVLSIGKRLYVGRSSRTNLQGIEALANFVSPHGYEVLPINVRGSLHLKTACTAIDDETLLVNSTWVDTREFTNLKKLIVPQEEPWAANTLRVGDTVFVQAGFPRTLELLERQCDRVETLDISEFRKAEAGLTCLSLVFEE